MHLWSFENRFLLVPRTKHYNRSLCIDSQTTLLVLKKWLKEPENQTFLLLLLVPGLSDFFLIRSTVKRGTKQHFRLI